MITNIELVESDHIQFGGKVTFIGDFFPNERFLGFLRCYKKPRKNSHGKSFIAIVTYINVKNDVSGLDDTVKDGCSIYYISGDDAEIDFTGSLEKLFDYGADYYDGTRVIDIYTRIVR